MSADQYHYPTYPGDPANPDQGQAQQAPGAMGQGQHAGAYYYMPQGVPMAYPAAQAPQQQSSSGLLGFTNDRFLKGLLIGAAATYILTNESVQRTAIKGVVKAWSLVQGGLEEAKERFHDAEAELHAADAAKAADQD